MSIKKTTCEKYAISNKGEYATICLSEHPPYEGPGARVTYGGELLVHSSFGNFAYTWTSCGTPFKEFLTGLDFSYLMPKLMGPAASVYCPKRTLVRLQQRLQALEADGTLTADEAVRLGQAILDKVAPYMDTEYEFVTRVGELEEDEDISDNQHYLLSDSQEYIEATANPQAVGFWLELWPQFRDALKSE